MRTTIIQATAVLVATFAIALVQRPYAATVRLPAHEVSMAARKFEFEPAALVVSAGEVVRLTIHSDDVVHGFAIPQMHIDVRIPEGGEAVTIEFVAPAPGQYDIICSKFCGHGHGDMKAVLISRPPAS
jgi:cytochrome c oxidase subunit 2